MAEKKPENQEIKTVRLPDMTKMTDAELKDYAKTVWEMIMEGMKKNKILMEKEAKKAGEQEKSDS